MSTRGRPASDPRRARHRLLDQPAWCGWTGGAPLGPAPTRRVTHPPTREVPAASGCGPGTNAEMTALMSTTSGPLPAAVRSRICGTGEHSCPAAQHHCTTSRVSLSRSRCLHFCACRHLAAGRRPDAEPRTGWLRLWSAVSRPDKRHGFQFGRRRRGFGCGGRFLARAEVGHPGARMPGRRWRPRRIG